MHTQKVKGVEFRSHVYYIQQVSTDIDQWLVDKIISQ